MQMAISPGKPLQLPLAQGSPPVNNSIAHQKCLIGHAHFHDAIAAMLISLCICASGQSHILQMGVLCRWDTWGRLIASHTSRFPWAVIEGNHEEEVANGRTGFLAYETRFWFPSEESRSYSPFYYSYEVRYCDVCLLEARSPAACSLHTL